VDVQKTQLTSELRNVKTLRAGSILVVISALGIGCWFYFAAILQPMVPGPTDNNYQRLTVGMPKQEVLSILGPPDAETSTAGMTTVVWRREDLLIELSINERVYPGTEVSPGTSDGSLQSIDGQIVNLRSADQGFYQKIRRWLPGRKQKHY
jgi:hypothetical protein